MQDSYIISAQTNSFLHLCVQKVVEAVLEEEVEEDGGDVGLRHGLVHWGMVRCQQCRDEPTISQ